MTIEERVYKALKLTGIPVTQRPVNGTGRQYLTWSLTLATPAAHSSNTPRRVQYMITIDVFDRQETTADELLAVLKKIKSAGIMPQSWGPESYETSTKWHHLPITCIYNDMLNIEQGGN